MDSKFGLLLALFLCLIGPVMSTMYCTSLTKSKVSAISCGNGYHCCEANTKCCLDAGHLPNGVIVGISVGGAVVVAAIVCLTVCFVKSRQNKHKLITENQNVPSAPEENAGYDQAAADQSNVVNPPPYSEPGNNPPKYMI